MNATHVSISKYVKGNILDLKNKRSQVGAGDL